MRLLGEGQTIRETYEVERFIGEGAFAEVYRVRHRFLGRQAMKIFKTPGMNVAEVEQTLAEAILLSKIGHPNIIRVFDANTLQRDDGSYGYFTMEYVAGGSLDDFWRSHGSRFVPVETVVEVMKQICRGLATAHGEKPPIIHRDIKPQNVLVGYEADGLRVRISDFGLAKRVNPLTLLASAKGTRCFKAPEALQDWFSDSCAGDVWALGVTMYLLLTDRLPFAPPATVGEDAAPRFDEPPISPGRLNATVDSQLEAIVQRALRPDPAARYRTAGDMLRDLDVWRPGGHKDGHAELAAALSGQASKEILGTRPTLDKRDARSKAREALRLAQESGRLIEAADLMEEAFIDSPPLREQYENRVTLWRRGVAM